MAEIDGNGKLSFQRHINVVGMCFMTRMACVEKDIYVKDWNRVQVFSDVMSFDVKKRNYYIIKFPPKLSSYNRKSIVYCFFCTVSQFIHTVEWRQTFFGYKAIIDSATNANS